MSGFNLDNCTETHVGPKINFNFVLNGNEGDTERALRPFNRILDEKLLSASNLHPKLTDRKLVTPSAPYESDSSAGSIADREKMEMTCEKPKKLGRNKRKGCIFGIGIVGFLVVAGLTGGIYFGAGKRHHTSATNSTTPPPPIPTYSKCSRLWSLGFCRGLDYDDL